MRRFFGHDRAASLVPVGGCQNFRGMGGRRGDKVAVRAPRPTAGWRVSTKPCVAVGQRSVTERLQSVEQRLGIVFPVASVATRGKAPQGW